ncbi:aspartate--tRNA ligase, partial [Klebsiella oxytoca]
EKTPEKCLGRRYDLVVNGVELGGGSTRIHDPRLQDYIFEDILKIDTAYELLGHLLNAFDMGTPPHAGFAIGFDRMCAMICETESIRDVIAFPKSITGADLVVKSPSVIPE